jgi:hypothetical protein
MIGMGFKIKTQQLIIIKKSIASPESTTATFADDTAVVAMYSDPAIASQKLQTNLLAIQNWFKKWRMKANEFNSIHVMFITRRETCLKSIQTVCNSPKKKTSSILGYKLRLRIHLDRRHLAQIQFCKNGNN